MKAKDAKATAAERRAEYEAWYEEQVRLGLDDPAAGLSALSVRMWQR